ncbi:hypothetical protein HZB01_03705 [Candidatus Woesearchaeota archaeon]|nr:hypothetical protein [Candidatus Woesearchaeota archaeon]
MDYKKVMVKTIKTTILKKQQVFYSTMFSLKPLNSKEVRNIQKKLVEQWGCSLPGEFVLFQNQKNKLYLTNREIGLMDPKNFRIDAMGLYVGEVQEDGIRLSIEGSQIIGKNATQNVVSLSEQQMRAWMNGEQVTVDDAYNCRCHVLVRYLDDFLGCGKLKGTSLLNYVPKERRMLA